MGIRIDPTLEFLWRDPQTVQIGVDPVRAVVPVPTLAQERLLSLLRSETAREALPALADQVRCAPDQAAALFGAVAPTMLESVPLPTRRVEILGTVDVAERIAAYLGDEGVAVQRSASTTATSTATATATATATTRAGDAPARPDPDLAIVVAEHVVDPTVRAAWSRRNTPHLPVVVGDGRVRIGPLIEPDDGPCLACLELHRTDEEPAWPTLASQLWGRRAAPLSMLRSATVATHVAAAVLERLPFRSARGSGEQLIMERQDLRVSRRTLAAHPACACRALPGTDSAGAHRTEHSPVAPTSPSPIGALA